MSSFFKLVFIGLITLLPAGAVLWLAYKILSLLDGAPQWVFTVVFGREIPGAGWIASIAFLFLVGVLISKTPAVKLLSWIEGYLVPKVAFFGSIYKALRQFLDTVSKSANQSFSKVVMVPWPDKNHLTLGFVTKEYIFSPGRVAYCVEYLTTPNFTSGMPPAIVRKEDVFEVGDISIKEGFEYVMSAGLVTPVSMDLAKLEKVLWREVPDRAS